MSRGGEKPLHDRVVVEEIDIPFHGWDRSVTPFPYEVQGDVPGDSTGFAKATLSEPVRPDTGAAGASSGAISRLVKSTLQERVQSRTSAGEEPVEAISHLNKPTVVIDDTAAAASIRGSSNLEIKQRKLRRSLLHTCSRVREMIRENARFGVETVFERARAIMEQLEEVHCVISEELNNATAFDTQEKRHLDCLQDIATTEGELKLFLSENRMDAPLVRFNQPEEHQPAAAEEVEDSNDVIQRRRVTQAQQVAEEARAAANAAAVVADAAAAALFELTLSEIGRVEPQPHRSASQASLPDLQRTGQWIDQLPHSTRSATSAPDDWIDIYIRGQEKAIKLGSGHHSSVKTELEPYSGKALEWFSWVDLFHALVHQTTKLPGEKLAILKRSLRGDCYNIVLGLGGGEDAYKEALRRLKKDYGRRDVMRAAHLHVVETTFPVKDPSGFKRYADRIRSHLFDLSRLGELSHADVIERVTQKLQLSDRLAWNEGRGGGLETRTMDEFGDWLCSRAAAYQNAHSIALEQAGSSTRTGTNTVGFRADLTKTHRARNHHTASGKSPATVKTTANSKRHFCFYCEAAHWIETCPGFEGLSVGERLKFCQRHRLCFACLWSGHSSRDCRKKKECREDGCALKHHYLLHETADVESTRAANSHSARVKATKVALGVMCLSVLSSKGELVPASVMVDEASDTTLVREGFARRVGLLGPFQSLRVRGTGGVQSCYQSRVVDLNLQSEFGEIVPIRGSTLPCVADPVPVIDWREMQSKWHHLKDIPLRRSGGRVDILLGLDYATLSAPIESHIGGDHEPVALKSRLGWIVRGVVGLDEGPKTARVHHALSSSFDFDSTYKLAEAVKKLFDTESFGTEYQTECLSPENRRAIEMLRDGLKKLDIGYEAPILWKEGKLNLVNNRAMAEYRLSSLLRRFGKEPDYEKMYRRAMAINFDEGYAIRLTADQIAAGPAYYLPHFGVLKDKKIRIVYDAAAKFRGQCLNDAICAGPALQNPLPAVLIKFREGSVAWSADIKAMFSRIRLSEADANYHRFLWPEEDGTISVCRMERLTFGVNCSPFVAISTTWRAADDAGPKRAEASAEIRTSIYVDDYLGSSSSIEKGVRTALDVQSILGAGDFHLRGWMSNSPEFTNRLRADPNQVKENGLTHTLCSEDTELVLGVVWRPATDTLGFRLARLDDISYTRVGLLSKVAAFFDPLGVASPMTVKARIRLRQLDTRGLKWTDPIADEDRSWWQQWFQTLRQLKHVEFPRCLFPSEDSLISIELHAFCDASEEAYAAVVYTRSLFKSGNIVVRQVKASTKLAPKKTLSIPKLELNAALLGSRLARFVQSSLTRRIVRRYFWTDSSTTRNWIRATAAFYQTFVSHRIGEIQTLTEAKEWRFVPGRQNPADGATRSEVECEAIPPDWLEGPPFLHGPEEQWPVDIPWTVVKDEIRTAHAHHSSIKQNVFDWKTVDLTVDNLSAFVQLNGEHKDLVKRAQNEVYEEELKRLTAGKDLRASSPLLGMTPFLDVDGLLRLGGRIGRCRLPYDRVHPVILPGSHPLSQLLTMAFHEKLRHAGTDFILSHIRQHFWMTGGREAVKKARNSCRYCLLQRGKPASQLMGCLPTSRLDIEAAPFSHVAVDYFGPFDIGLSRNRTAKRWGALFTCHVTRAVYLDLATSLSTDDFMLVLRRFIGIYGRPTHFYSDNGTNFVGAERELREAVDVLLADSGLERKLAKDGIRWHFQPARTPHFGGAHESLVRSTKKALYAALAMESDCLRHPTEDMLRTLLFEVAGLLNTRPLTSASSDPSDLRPLTPNDFLNRSPTADNPSGDFSFALPRERFKYVQRLRKLFKDLWRGTYLQSMADRKKWKQTGRNLSVGDYVAEIKPGVKNLDWNTGRIVQVYAGSDGLVRAVDVKLPQGVFRRGVTQLCLLEPVSTGSEVPVSGENVTASRALDAV